MNKNIMFLFCSIFLLFGGCAKYGNHKLSRLISHIITEEGVFIHGKVLTKKETENLFGSPCNTENVTPIQLCINNTTKNSYIFSPRNINVKLIPLNTIARSLYKNIIARVVPLGIVSCFFLPLSIPTTILGMRAAHHNENVDKQLDDLGIDPFDCFIIEPYSTLNRILFVKNKHFSHKMIVQLEQSNTADIHELSVHFNSLSSKVIQKS